jgi:2-polyprenyl-3-methyl-5-hydroxy-6-metoxy-1,4-benzoquinol methylase
MTDEYGTKYDTEVDLEGNSSHVLILDLVGYDKRVLDVGASTGYLAEIMTNRGCRVTGIEVDPEAARQAAERCERVVVGDVESLDLDGELGDERFDAIVFGDVLEHLKDPSWALERFTPFLSPGGYVVTSIPNIAHGSVRLALMQGRFEYRSLGLLDNTHLKFFTRDSVEEMLEDAGFLVTELRRTKQGIFDTEIEIDRDQVSDESLRQVREDPEALTYQFVLKVIPLGEAGGLTTKVHEKTILELTKKARRAGDMQNLLEIRTRELAEKDREVARLTQEVFDLNNQLAKMVQSGKGNA